MRKDVFKFETIVTAERGNYLKLNGVENSEELIGRPERIILSNSGKIPEFIEEVIKEDVIEEQKVEEAPKKKTTRKRTTKKTTAKE